MRIMVNSENLHHVHLRKRIHKNLEEYPHPNTIKRFVDILIYIAAFAGIIFTIPQITLIWINHQTAGVSPISWTAYTLIAMIWIGYGVLHRERNLIIINCANFIVNLAVIIGLIIYG